MGPPLPDELTAFLDAYAYPAAIVIAGDFTFENARFAALRTAHGAPLLRTLLASADAAAPRVATPLSGAPAPPLAWTLTRQRVAQRGLSVVRTVLLAQDAPAGAEESVGTEGPTDIDRIADGERPAGGEGPVDVERRAGAPVAAAPIPRAPGPDRSWEADIRFKAIATGGGDLGDLIRAHDWQHTPLGPIGSWCDNLVSAVVRQSPVPSVSRDSCRTEHDAVVAAPNLDLVRLAAIRSARQLTRVQVGLSTLYPHIQQPLCHHHRGR
jgi:hypothetical protein